MPTRHVGSQQEQRALNLFIALSRSSEWMQKGALNEAPLPDSLTLTQFGVLEALYHLGSMCQSNLGKKLLKTKGNVSVVVDRLVERGLVERRPDSKDKRYVLVDLTPSGRSLIECYFPRIAVGFARTAAVLTAEEQETLTMLSKKLGYTIQHQMSKGE